MNNRRVYYRFDFAAEERLAVDVTVPGSATILQGTILNLSIGGMSIGVEGATPVWKLADKCYLRFSLPTVRLTLPALLVHAEGKDSLQLGFRFLPSADATALEAREKVIWCYLLEEQRRRRRARLAAAG